MYCSTCGTQISNDTMLCPGCHADLSAMSRPNTQSGESVSSQLAMTHEQYARFQQERDLKSNLANAEERVSSLVGRLAYCGIIGAIAAFLIIAFDGSIDVFLAKVFMAGVAFFLPFGFMPVMDFMRRNGFFAWGWFMLVILFALVLVFAAFAGLPYAIYLIYQIKKANKERDDISKKLSAIA